MVLTPTPALCPPHLLLRCRLPMQAFTRWQRHQKISQPAWQGFRNQMLVTANCRGQMKLPPEQYHRNSSTYTRGQ